MLQFAVGIARNLNEGMKFSHFNLCRLGIQGTNKDIFLRRLKNNLNSSFGIFQAKQ